MAMFAVDRFKNEYYRNSKVPILFTGENVLITDSSPGIICPAIGLCGGDPALCCPPTADQKGGHFLISCLQPELSNAAAPRSMSSP